MAPISAVSPASWEGFDEGIVKIGSALGPAGAPFSEAPFSEATFSYCTAEFPFAVLVADLFRDLVPELRLPLEDIHGSDKSAASRLRRMLRTASDREHKRKTVKAFGDLWREFVRRVILPHLGEEWVAFEREPNIRVHFARQKATTAPHCDSDHFHSPFEVNFWIPVVDVDGAASLWAESSPGAGDFHPFAARYGEAVRFYGNACQHFTVDNSTRRTRVSFDARVIRGRDVARA
eukprot:CAMPEP_0198526588 /NCGR_PEP_ID=MMETSP1462-20131121/24049_1 /TAXON_ID=1333877 /ORGANISM="Brandtodinium nutriculum, Strain RCC3387" /LENGTH=233 /DNA_ID=CAMNT_0044256373 /DNA_START=40 /DNA_END=737 /DNA_ORIENTATION=-